MHDQEKTTWTTCSSHCGGICRLKVHVKKGVITKIESDDGEEPQLRACLRGRAMRQRVYASDRIKYPLKRVGKRGQGKFERISWEEALSSIAEELKRIKETYGSQSIMFMGGGGDTTFVHGGGRGVQKVLSLLGGYSSAWGYNSWEGAMFASAATFGTVYVENSRDDLLNSRMIILWGCDPAVTTHSTNTMWYLIQAKEKGTEIVCIDPMFSDTNATLTDRWIPIRPSTDTAMAIAMAYTIIKERLHEQTFVDRYTIGFEAFEDYLTGKQDGIVKTALWAEKITGVNADIIERLAVEYAKTKPAALISGIAPGRTAMGEQYHRATIALAVLTGNIGVRGGGAGGRSLGEQYPFNPYPFKLGQFMNVPPNPVDTIAGDNRLTLKNYTIWRSSAMVHRSKLADAILKGKSGGYPADYKLFYVLNCNPVNQLPCTSKWSEALNKLEFMVVHEQFMTATARFADIVLPSTTLLERNDIIAGGATPFYGRVNKVIEPLYESKSHLEIAKMLAAHLGLSEYGAKTDEELVRQIADGSSIPDYASFKEKGIYRIKLKEPFVSFRDQIKDPENNPFPTPSGKIEIYSEQLAKLNDPLIPAIPKYLEPWEGPNDSLAMRYPLQLINKHVKRRAHSQLETLPWLKEVEMHAIQINTLDAETRNIHDGNVVRVFNDRGTIVIPAKVTERIMPGVICLPQGAWYAPDKNGYDHGGCANTLTKEQHSPCGVLVTNSCLVQVEKYGV